MYGKTQLKMRSEMRINFIKFKDDIEQYIEEMIEDFMAPLMPMFLRMMGIRFMIDYKDEQKYLEDNK